MPFVFSTASTHISFCQYSKHVKNRVPTVLKKVTIRGGANVAQKKTLFTPKGVATPVSQEDLDFLLQNKKFLEMQKKGFFAISKAEDDLKYVQAGMTEKDGTAPKTDKDFAAPPGAGLEPGAVKVGAPSAA